MITTADLFASVENAHIKVHWADLAGRLRGCYYADKNQKIILLANSIANQETVLRCVLAEELGHHFTSIGVCLPVVGLSYIGRLINVDRQEAKAVRWAVNYLLPTAYFIEAAHEETWQVAERFMVTEEFVKLKQRLLRRGSYEESRVGDGASNYADSYGMG